MSDQIQQTLINKILILLDINGVDFSQINIKYDYNIIICQYFILTFDPALNLYDIAFNVLNKQKETAICLYTITQCFTEIFSESKESQHSSLRILDDFYASESLIYKINDKYYNKVQ